MMKVFNCRCHFSFHAKDMKTARAKIKTIKLPRGMNPLYFEFVWDITSKAQKLKNKEVE